MVSITELYWGEISALLGALFSAAGNTLYRLSSEEMDLISISLIRNILGFPFSSVYHIPHFFSIEFYKMFLLFLRVDGPGVIKRHLKICTIGVQPC